MGKPTGFMEYDRQTSEAVKPRERIKNFNEFHIPLSLEQQQLQGARCMACGVPFCQYGKMINGMASGCPLNNLVPEWNDLVYTGNWEEAYMRLSKTSCFPEFTSRVCPALCEAACTCNLNGDPVSTKENERIILQENSKPVGSVLCRPKPVPRSSQTDIPRKTVRILMMDTPQVHTLLGLLKNFENQTNLHADITILPHHYLYETILQKHYSEEEIPYDVFMYDIPWLSSLASQHILEDITEELDNMDLDIFLPDCLKYFSTFENRYYGLPFMYAPQILYYRKDLFENPELQAEYKRQNSITLRPPLTLKEFNTIADFFTNRTKAVSYGISIPAAYAECLAPEIYMRLRAFGGSLFDSRGNVCLDRTPSLKAYINFVRSVRLAKPDYRSATDTSIVQDFLKGETAMLITYPSFLTDVVDLRKSSMNGSIGYHHIPGRSPLLGGWSLGISSRTSQKKEAFSFLKWICDEQIANYFALLGGQSAITSTYTNDELNKLYPWLPLYLSTYPYTEPVVPPHLKNRAIPAQSEIDSIVCRWVYELLDDKLEVQEAITNTHRELEELIEKLGGK